MWSVKLDVCIAVYWIRRWIKNLLCEELEIVFSGCKIGGGSSSLISYKVKYLPVKNLCVAPNGLGSWLRNFSRAALLVSRTLRLWRAARRRMTVLCGLPSV